MIEQHFKEELARATRLFWKKELTPGQDSGDLSIRDPETGLIYICPRPNETLMIPNWGVITAEDMVVMDIDGNLMEDSGILATVEAPTHLHIYRARPNVRAIIHSHAVWSSAFAVAGRNIPLVLAEQALFLGGEIICAEYGKVGSEKLAENMTRALGQDKMAVLMRNHGAVCVGESMDEAFIVSDFLEKGAQTTLLAHLIATPIEISPDDILDDSLL